MLPDSVKTIGSQAFYSCDKLASIYVNNNEIEIYDSSNTFSSNSIIYGHNCSTSKDYANK